MAVPDLRIRRLNDQTPRPDGRYILYWMTASRRGAWNFGLQRAVEWARRCQRPLLVLEAVRCGYKWASDRFQQFVVEGMEQNERWFAERSTAYYPYVEPAEGAGRGLIERLAQDACVVVTDDYPCFFLPRMASLTARRLNVLVETVDSNGLVPMRATEQVFTMAHSFRRWIQKNIKPYLAEFPHPDPLAGATLPRLDRMPADVERQWPRSPVGRLAAARDWSAFPLDHSVAPTRIRGGAEAAGVLLRDFLDRKLPRYGTERNEPQQDVTTGLSPHLHFGHISTHEIFDAAMRKAGWHLSLLTNPVNGSAHGWWNCPPELESFLDELITWREIGFNFCSHRGDYDRFSSLPEWAQATMRLHQSDRRAYVYTLDEFEQSKTHDRLWNAAQRQLVREGRIHNYLRMLWGKKILEWTLKPEDALAVMIELNNKYALDGRDPNSYSGIFWVLGRYDRAWGPERPIFGTIRYMTSDNTARKVDVKEYVKKYQ